MGFSRRRETDLSHAHATVYVTGNTGVGGPEGARRTLCHEKLNKTCSFFKLNSFSKVFD